MTKENKIINTISIKFEQLPDGKVRWSIKPDDWVLNWQDMSPGAMAIARVPLATIAARILYEMVELNGVERALEYAVECQEKAARVHARARRDSSKVAGEDEVELGDTVH